MKLKPTRKISGRVLVGIGLAVVVAEVALHFISAYLERDYDLNHFVVVTGALLIFIGFWIIDPAKTKAATDIIAERFGRRRTDASASPDTISVTVPHSHDSKQPTVIKTEILNGGTGQDSG